MKHFAESFLGLYSIDTPVQDLWDVFKNQCYDCLELVPSIFPSKSATNPWTNSDVKRLTNKKQRLYNKARRSQLQSDWLAYKELKKQVQRECRKAHDKYVSNLINSDNERANKKILVLY